MANNLKRLRESTNLSTRDLGTKTGINYGTLSRMENGLQQIPEEYAKILADIFNVSLDKLFNRTFQEVNPKPIIIEKEPTYTNILAGLDACTTEQLDRIESIIHDYIKPQREKKKEHAVPNGKDKAIEEVKTRQ